MCFKVFGITSIFLFQFQAATGQAPSGFVLDNSKIEISITPAGGAFTSIVLKDDPERLNPFSRVYGHFVCADVFGPPSAEEREAGFRQHGEAHYQEWHLLSNGKTGNVATLAYGTRLPLANEDIVRTVRIVDGEQIIYVGNVLENLSPIDRPIMWQEHATVGSPFLKPGVTVVDISADAAMTRPLRIGNGPAAPEPSAGLRFKPGERFQWPSAPGPDGKSVDLRQTSPDVPINAITIQHMPGNQLAFATALNLEKRLILGYVFRASDFPWTQHWESYAASGDLNRGLEFGTSPFGMPRREAVNMATLFDTPTFRWLPAKGKVETSFLMFIAQVPDGMRGVDRVTVSGGYLMIQDLTAGRELKLAASLAR